MFYKFFLFTPSSNGEGAKWLFLIDDILLNYSQ